MSDEEWRPVVGYEGLYEVSSRGRVRSLDRVTSENGRFGERVVRRTGKVLTSRPHVRTGHLLVSLSGTSKYLHRLVAEAFIPNPAGHPLVRHWDDNPADNRVENLRWGTKRDNYTDAVRNGRIDAPGSASSCPHQHPYTEENTYLNPRGHRVCRTCRVQGQNRRRNTHLPPGDSRHGLTGYTYGCRCEECVGRAREYRVSYRNRPR